MRAHRVAGPPATPRRHRQPRRLEADVEELGPVEASVEEARQRVEADVETCVYWGNGPTGQFTNDGVLMNGPK